jgi:hypothetical protein
MGFTVYYRSTRPVSADEAAALRRAASAANAGRTWLSCEPVLFFSDLEDGRLVGGSKPNFIPHPDDVAAAARAGEPDGDVRSLLEVLCRPSRDHRIDWVFSHDHDAGPIGFIRGGVCEEQLAAQIDMIASLAEILAEESDGFDEGVA